MTSRFYPLANRNKQYKQALCLTIIIALTIFLNGCLSTTKKNIPEPVKQESVTEVVLPTAEPIKNASRKEIVYAQSALKKLGYPIRSIDGIWGPRSAQAMQNFEQRNQLQSANGHLSQLNLFILEKQSGIRIDDVHQPKVKKKKKPTGLTAQVGQQANFSKGPKLVIANRNYNLYKSPSLEATQPTVITKGTGLFVIGKYDNWYKVEAEDKTRGYIQAR